MFVTKRVRMFNLCLFIGDAESPTPLPTSMESIAVSSQCSPLDAKLP